MQVQLRGSVQHATSQKQFCCGAKGPQATHLHRLEGRGEAAEDKVVERSVNRKDIGARRHVTPAEDGEAVWCGIVDVTEGGRGQGWWRR